MLLRMKIRILRTHANLSLFFPDRNWYISVVLLYVIAAFVWSNKRYSNPLAHCIFAYSCTYILYCKVRSVTVMSVRFTVP